MRILLWHGYLLRGTGSNIYKSNLVRAWRNAGHQVLLLCQERVVDGLDFVDEHGDFSSDNRSFELRPTGVAESSGRVSLVRPAIGEILPVYVYDRYEGFSAKRYTDLSDVELHHYVSANFSAMVTAIERFRPDSIITSHEVMGPYIALRACTRTNTGYTAQLHGSALEYAVKLQPRYRDFAIEGLSGARVVVGGSEYMIREASSVIPGWRHKAVVVNPGCDTDLFRPRALDGSSPPTAGYVGKFIAQKGVHHFLAALGRTKTVELRAVVVGYGDLEHDLHRQWSAVVDGDTEEFIESGRRTDRVFRDFVRAVSRDPTYFARAGQIGVEFTGRLDHDELWKVLPGFDVLVVPSVGPEAFGMVGAEAAACGVLPIVPDHSGIGEVGAAVEEAIGRPGLLTFDPGKPIEGIAEAIDRVLELPGDERRELGAAAAKLARERWSWPVVAERLLGHALAASKS
jgi:glycosyltransferase involved in cell wall biosynthesis